MVVHGRHAPRDEDSRVKLSAMQTTGLCAFFRRPGIRPPALASLLLVGVVLAVQAADVPYVPTPPHVVEAMLKLAAVKPGEMVYDLGCGDGRIVVAAAKKFKARGTGVDISEERIQEAEANARSAGVADRVRFIQKNLFEADFRDAAVVTLYLLPDVNLRLRPRLLSQLRIGSRIVSHSFDMGDWKPDKTISVDHRTLHLWVVTAEAKQALKEGGTGALRKSR